MRLDPGDWIDRRPTEAIIKRHLRDKPAKVSAGGWCEGWDEERWGDTIREVTTEEWRGMWGVPDWRDASAYPHKMTETGMRSSDKYALTQDQWRWEFLRRYSDYRDCWDTFAKGVMPCAEGKGNKYPLLSEDDAFRRLPKNCDVLGFYELGCMIEPSRKGHDVAPKLFVRKNQGQRQTKLSAESVAKLLPESRYAVVVFDTHRPLAEQFNRARARLDVLQKEEMAAQNAAAKGKGKVSHRRGADYKIDDVIMKNPPAETLRRFLRVLDAYLERAPIKEIGKVLYNSNDYANAQSRYNKEYSQAARMWEWL